MEEVRKAKILNKRKRKAENENNKLLIVSTSADLAELHMKQGRYQDAINEYETIANIYISNNKLEYAKAHRGIGEAYMGLQKFEEALKHQKIYLNIALEEKDDLEQQRAYATIGHMYLSHYLETQNDPKKNLNNAYTNFMKSLMIAENLTGIPKLEKADMLARLLSNLGLVKESLGDYSKASELLKRSVAMCKQHDIYEQLIRGYMSIASLHDKQGQSNAINDAIHHYNLAIDAAKNLKGSVDLICAALLAKSDLLLKVSDFHSAKQALVKAYKLKTPNIQDRNEIEKKLKIVATMCQIEDNLFVSCNNDEELEKLYEKMGDYACSLKHFAKAIEYYKLTLRHAEKSGTSGKKLASYYYSLGECYKDMSQYEEAVEYFEKEYNLCDNLKDNLNTLSKIADTKEAANADVTEVRAVYERAFTNCRNSGNLKEERRMIQRCIQYLRRSNNHSAAFQIEKYFETLDVPDDDDTSSSSDSESEVNLEGGIEINLEDITDNSEDSDIDSKSKNETSSLVGRRRNKNIVKKNAKGESKLHLACINGQVPVVRHLLQQGHPVNIRDNSGWLPLHEACNHGHLEIVKLLLDKGATINDRGGTQCDGITPLYDAANNGHLRIVELLLERGASAVVKTDTGDSALNVLRTWHRNNPFVGDDLELYEKITRKMSEALEKLGHKVDEEEEEDRVGSDNRQGGAGEKRNRSMIGGKENRSRSYQAPAEGSCTEDTNLCDFFEDDGDQFLRKITPPRKKITEPNPCQSSSKRSSLVPENDLFDDWLEDDLGMMNAAKKRKTNSVEGPEWGGERVSVSPRKSQKSPLNRKSNESDIPDVILSDNSDGDLMEIQSIPFQNRNTSLTQLSNRKRNRVSSPFQRKSSLTRNSSFEGTNIRQPKITNFVNNASFVEADSTTSSSSQEAPRSQIATQIPVAVDLMVFVDVKVEGMVFRVPVRVSQLQTHSIGWLAEEAAQKYARKECSKPCLELETTSGALLSNEDPLTLLFPLGTMTAEPVVGKIVKLCLPPLIERYKEACTQMNTTTNDVVSSTIEEMSVRLSLENNGLSSSILTPLCMAINHQTSLLEINLSGNFVDSSCLAKLCFSLPSLVNLTTLNLSSTGLQAVHLAEFVKIFTTASKPILDKLTCLDFSDNPLRNKSLQHLSEITRYLRPKSLNLSNCRFKQIVCQGDRHCLTLENTETLDVSDNHLQTCDIKKLVSWTVAGVLTELDVSRNDANNRKVLDSLLDLWKEHPDIIVLKSLSLSRCNVDETELYELLRLCSGKSLERLNLSYNPNLTGISLRRLLEYSPLREIDLLGCQNIFQYFDQLQDHQESAQRILKISTDANVHSAEIAAVIKAFEKLYSSVSVETGDVLIVKGIR